VTESEIESFAGMKNVSDEIRRQIGSHKEVDTRHYGVVSSLVEEPAHAAGRSRWAMVSAPQPEGHQEPLRGPQRPRGDPQAGPEVHTHVPGDRRQKK
jgi:hypothetical protein